MNEHYDRPSRFPWPPVLALIFASVAWFGTPPNWLGTWQTWLGGGLIGMGLLFDAVSAAHLLRRKTTVLPHRAASSLVTNGPFAFSRNPIYLGYAMILVGIFVLRPGAMSAFAAGVFGIILFKASIEPEEKHLAARFGQEWAEYARRVPRWIGRP
ncbi:MAG: isoprenylcysteine carboxylmethyltransferase family protein [Pseudomonadota bacterium]